MYGFYRLKQEKDVLVCWRRFKNRYKQYDADCTITPLATKTRWSICTRPKVTKVLEKFSEAVSVKHTSYNWRNGEATLFIRYTEEPFSLKNALCLDEISDWFLFSVICTIADSLEKFDSNEKLNASQFSKFNFRFEVWIYLVWYVIQKTHDEFKANESVCIAKFEQQYVITIMKIFENEPKSRWLDEKMFYC